MSIWRRTKYVIAITLFISISYFLTQNLVTSHALDLLLPIDKQIPFIPEFVWIYNTLLPMLVLSSIFLIKNKKIFLTAGLSFLLAAMVLNVFYVLLPSFYPRESFEITGAATWFLSLTKELDGSNNTFPSGHVTLSWLLFLNIAKANAIKNRIIPKILFFVWAIGISISTVVLKQHYIVDVFAGIILALLCFWGARQYIKRNPMTPKVIGSESENFQAQLAE